MLTKVLMLAVICILSLFSGVQSADSAKTLAVKPATEKPITKQVGKPEGKTQGGKSQPAQSESKRISDGQRDFCQIVLECHLPMPKNYCPDSAALGPERFTYDNTRCLEARQLQARGVGPDHPRVGYRLYRFLGMEYRVIYNVEDEIPISAPRLNYLLQDLPLSAKLISHYRKEPYAAQYTDEHRKSFTGTKGKRLRGEATLISGNVDEKHLFYFGTGVAEVAWWVLKGPALMDFSYAPKSGDAKSVKYTMKVLVFPGNGLINKIMNMGLFRKIVLGKIKEVLIDITETAKLMAKNSATDALKSPAFTSEEKAKIEAFLKLP
jgi:hypothetical protein